MDDRAEIWIARDPDTNTESRAVSLRKLRKGVRIGRLKPSVLVRRVDATEWVSLERLIADADVLSKTSPPVGAAREVGARPPPRPAPRPATLPPVMVSPSTPTVEARSETTDEITEVEEVERAAAAAPPAEDPTREMAAVTPAPSTAAADAAVAEAEPAPSSADRGGFHRVPSAPSDEEAALTMQWFTESVIPPEPDDDEPIFPNRSLLDVNFEHVLTTRFVKLAWVLLIASLSLAVLASLIHAIAAVLGGDATQTATAVALVPVVVLACAVIGAFGRMMLEVLLAVFKIADRLTALSKSVSR